MFTMQKKRILCIINPLSGIGKQRNIEMQASKLIDKTRFDVDFAYTNGAKHATEIAKKAATEYDIIAAVGGDGTIHEVAAGMMHSDCALAIIPTGSGNGLARCLRIPMDLSKAIQVLNNGIIKSIDSVLCNEHVFVNVAGVGFDAEVGHLFATQTKRGFWSYLKIVLSEFRSYQSKQYVVEMDGVKGTFDAFLISIANSNQYGNNIKIAPQASLQDGLVDICILRKFPFYATPLLAWHLLRGMIEKNKHVDMFQVKQITIQSDDDMLKIHLDGEPLVIQKAMTMTVIPASLNVLVPR